MRRSLVCDKNVVLFHAEQSLLEQMVMWERQHQDYTLVLFESDLTASARAAVRNATAVIIDAPRSTQRARKLVATIADSDCDSSLAVYAERPEPELERSIRQCGVLFLCGPLAMDQWESVIGPKQPEASATDDPTSLSSLSLGSGGRPTTWAHPLRTNRAKPTDRRSGG